MSQEKITIKKRMIKKNNQFVISPHAVWEDQMVFWFVFFFLHVCGVYVGLQEHLLMMSALVHVWCTTTPLLHSWFLTLVKYQDIHFRYNVKSYLDQMCWFHTYLMCKFDLLRDENILEVIWVDSFIRVT